MWPGRGGIIGGANVAVTQTNPNPNIPTTTQAAGLWTPSQAAFYMNNNFQGLDWPTLADPSYANVPFLIHMDEHDPNGNLRMLSWAANPNDGDAFENLGNATATGIGRWSTRKFGIYSWQSAASCVIDHNQNTAVTIGTGNATAEGWCYLTSTTGIGALWDWRSGAGDTVHPLFRTNVGKLSFFKNGVAVVEDTSAMSTNTWHHWAWCRDTVAAKSYIYLDGVSVGTPAADTTNYTTMTTLRIGNNITIANPFVGFLDEFRLTVGTARYPGGTTFTVPSTPFPDY